MSYFTLHNYAIGYYSKYRFMFPLTYTNVGSGAPSNLAVFLLLKVNEDFAWNKYLLLRLCLGNRSIGCS